MKAQHVRLIALVLLWFSGLTAVAGGLSLVFGLNKPEADLLVGSPFSGFVVPGLILALAVGGSALWAAWALQRRQANAPLLTLAAGLVLTGWIIGETFLLTEHHWLQLLYLLIGIKLIGIALVYGNRLVGGTVPTPPSVDGGSTDAA